MKKNHFLVAVDPSVEVQKHFEWIKQKFLQPGDSISILAVLPERDQIDNSGDEQMVRMQLQGLLSTIGIEGVDKRSFVTFGKPAEEIVKKGNELEPTAIVMCSSGKNTLTTFFVGSVCEKVLKMTKIPVMVLK